MKRSFFRRFVFTLHLYVGLIAGLLLALCGLTGSALVFDNEIDARLHPTLLRVTAQGTKPVALQTIVQNVNSAYPQDTVKNIFLARGAHGTHEVWLQKSEERVYVHPYSGKILGVRHPHQHLMGWLSELHIRLLSGETGHTVIGIAGLLMVVLGVTGLVLWWPVRQGWRWGFTIHWRSGRKAINYDLHRVGGALTAGMLSIIALCGVMLVWSPFFTDILHRVAGQQKPAHRLTVQAQSTMQPLDSLVRKAEAQLPRGITTRVMLPAKPDAPLVVRRKLDNELHPNGMSFVSLDPYSGRVLKVESAARPSWADHWLNMRYPLHIGTWGGVASQILHVILGLVPAMLYITGFIMWWNRLRRSRQKKRADASSVVAIS